VPRSGRRPNSGSCGESGGYPTICKGRYSCSAQAEPYYAFEEPRSLNLSALLPELMRAGVTALKIEGRQRSRAYVKQVVGAFRRAVEVLVLPRLQRPEEQHDAERAKAESHTPALRVRPWQTCRDRHEDRGREDRGHER